MSSVGAVGPSVSNEHEDAAPLTTAAALRIWAPHLAALYLPLVALCFLLTAPHGGWVALLWIAVTGGLMQVADRVGGRQLHQPRADLPTWPFDGLLFVLVAVQLSNVLLLVRLLSLEGLLSGGSLVAVLLVGASSGYSGIVVAHELVHRRSWGLRQVGRLLLCTVLYEHFYTEHVRGHHVRVGTPDDPATALFGESFARFYIRTVPAQFRSAWRLEAQRLGDVEMPLLDRRQLGNRVLHGVIVEWGMAAAIGAFAGAAAFFGFVLQSLFASRALEVVNYFEHWGLARKAGPVRPVDSWDTHSRFTYYALTGLTRHADHHAHAGRPYQQLRVNEEAPVLPLGYIALFPLVLARNAKFRMLMTEELRRTKLGPFVEQPREQGGAEA